MDEKAKPKPKPAPVLLKILLVEDEPNDAELAMRNLKAFAETKWVKNQEDGLAALRAGEFDCVLLDLNLPNGKKESVLHKINEVRGAAATVIATGDGDPSLRHALMRLGADGFMWKGVDDRTSKEIEFVVNLALLHRRGIK